MADALSRPQDIGQYMDQCTAEIDGETFRAIADGANRNWEVLISSITVDMALAQQTCDANDPNIKSINDSDLCGAQEDDPDSWPFHHDSFNLCHLISQFSLIEAIKPTDTCTQYKKTHHSTLFMSQNRISPGPVKYIQFSY